MDIKNIELKKMQNKKKKKVLVSIDEELYNNLKPLLEKEGVKLSTFVNDALKSLYEFIIKSEDGKKS